MFTANFWSNLVSAILSGAVVAALSYYMFSDRPTQSNVEVEYAKIRYGSEILDDEISHSRDALEKFIEFLAQDETSDEERKEFSNALKGALDDFLLQSWKYALGSDSNFGLYGLAEEITVRSLERNASAKVQIEGQGITFAVIESRSNGNLIFRGDFNKEFKLLPNEELSIFNISKERTSFLGSEDMSDSVMVSVGGVYIRPPDKDTVLHFTFGSWIEKYPTVFFLLVISGIISVPVLLLQVAASLNVGWREAIASRTTSDDDLGMYARVLERMSNNDPDRYKQVMQKAKVNKV